MSSCEYLQHEGRLKIRLDDNVIEMLTIFDRHNPFTKFELQAITNLGCYGIIMYLLISSCLNKQNKEAEYTIDFLREQFNCVEKYPLFTDFKRFVIQPAIKEIELNTALRISFETIKKGKKTAKLKFFFREEIDKISKPKERRPKKFKNETNTLLIWLMATQMKSEQSQTGQSKSCWFAILMLVPPTSSTQETKP